jgi:hypothetical protein
MRKVWLFSNKIDLLLLALPVWIAWLICFLLPDEILHAELSLWVWVVLVIGFDVSHVWSTLFRTYLDKDERKNHQSVLWWAPILGFFLSLFVSLWSIDWFWRVLAYTALYHFVKQQYGFLRLYMAKLGHVNYHKKISDGTAIYVAMLYPIVFWHFSSDRVFSWFVDHDFLSFHLELSPWVYFGASLLFFVFMLFWWIEDIILCKQNNLSRPYGKWIWVWSTAFNWYLGIVYFNSDFAFTITNVVAHGLPYLVLIYIYVLKKNKLSKGNWLSHAGWKYGVLILASILVLALGEEYLWDMYLYRDNVWFFESIVPYPFDLLSNPFAQSLALALLSLPQVTHYILDGYIWKANAHNPFLNKVIFE